MDRANVVSLGNEVKSLSQIRRRAKRHGLVLKRRGVNQFALHRTTLIKPTYKDRRVEATRSEPVTDVLSLAEIMDLCAELDHVTEEVSIRAIESRIRSSMPTLFDRPLVAAESAVIQ